MLTRIENTELRFLDTYFELAIIHFQPLKVKSNPCALILRLARLEI